MRVNLEAAKVYSKLRHRLSDCAHKHAHICCLEQLFEEHKVLLNSPINKKNHNMQVIVSQLFPLKVSKVQTRQAPGEILELVILQFYLQSKLPNNPDQIPSFIIF